MEKTFEHLSLRESPATSKRQSVGTAESKTEKNSEKPLGEDRSSFSDIQRRSHLQDLEAKVEALRDMGVRSSPSKYSAEYFHVADKLVDNMRGIYAQANPLKRSVIRHAQFEDTETRLVRKTRQKSRNHIASGRDLDMQIRNLDAATIKKRTILTEHATSSLEAPSGHTPLPAALHRDAFHKLAVEIHSMVQELVKINVKPEVLESILQTDTPQAAKWREHWNSIAPAEPLKAMQQRLVDTRNLSEAYSAATLLGEQIAHTGQGDLKPIDTQIDAARSYASKDTKPHVAPVIARMEAILGASKSALAESAAHDLEILEPQATRRTTIAKASRDRAKLTINNLSAVAHPETDALAARFETISANPAT